MSEELKQKGYLKNGKITKKHFFKDRYEVWNIGATTFKQLKELKHFKNFNIPNELNSQKPDAFIYDNETGKFLCVIEFKKNLNSDRKIEDTKEQALGYCRALNCKIAIISDSGSYYYYNATNGQEIKDEDGNSLKSQISLDVSQIVPSQIDFLEKIDRELTTKNSKLSKAQLVDPSDLALKIWQTIWINNRTTPKKSLLTFVEFMMLKFLSDLNILTTDENGNDISFNSLISKNPNQRLGYYLQTVRPKIKEMFPASNHTEKGFSKDKTTILNGFPLATNNEDDKRVFSEIIDLVKTYKMVNINPEFKSKLFELFFKESKENIGSMGQFFTPRTVIKSLVRISGIESLQDGDIVCDPACGVGGFLLEPLLNLRKYDFVKDDKSKISTKIKYEGFDLKSDDESDLLTTILAKANFVIHASEQISNNTGNTKDFANIFNEMFKCYTDTNLGSLSTIHHNRYKLIFSNPPYVVSGSAQIKEQAKGIGYEWGGSGLEGLFLEKIAKEVKEDGRAIVVLPDGIFYRSSDKNLRKMIYQNFKIEGIISLPQKTFFNTPKKTFVLIIRKYKSGEEKVKEYPVFSYFIKNIGETLDALRLPTEHNDLISMENSFKVFQATGKNLLKDNRVEILDSTLFENCENWDITKIISEERKKELGLIDEKIVLSLKEFKKALIDLSKEIDSVSKELGDE